MSTGLSFRSAAFWAAALTLFASAAGFLALVSAKDLYLTKLPIQPVDSAGNFMPLRTLPTKVPGWNAPREDEKLSKESQDELGTDNYVSRWFVESPAPEGRAAMSLELHCAYYTGTIDTVPHVPERCLVGGGMAIDGASVIVDVPIDMSRMVIDSDVDQSKYGLIYKARSPVTQTRFRVPAGIDKLRMSVTRFRSQSGDRVLHAGYFFMANGGLVPTADEVRLMSFKLEDDYSYYMKVQFSSMSVESPQELAKLAGRFLDEMLPELAQRVPDWVDVKEGRYPGTSAAERAAGGSGG